MHEPYATWILTDASLTPEEQAALETHLAHCASCRELAQGWRTIQKGLGQLPEIPPPPGFLARWQAFRQAREAQIRRRQAILLLGWLIFGGLLLMLPEVWLDQGLLPQGIHPVSALVRLIVQARVWWTLGRSFSGLLSTPTLMALLGGFAASGALWVGLWVWLLTYTAQRTAPGSTLNGRL